MKNWLIRLGLLAALIAAGIWGWHFFFPGPERVIRKQLNELARAASIAPNEAPLARLSNAQRLTTFFSGDVQIFVDVPGYSAHTFSGRDELLQAAIGARNILNALKVEFPDIKIVLGPDKTAAIANLTARADVPGSKNVEVQELKLELHRIDGHWLVTRVETVRTLR